MNRKGIRNPRAISLALLCLIAHALFVCVTHHHSNNIALASGVRINASDESGSQSAPDSSSDAQCVSCRLHSNFISDNHSNSVLVELARDLSIRDTALVDPHSRSVALPVFGRAPPLA